MAHASYLMNSYYQTKGRNDFNCDFQNTGLITNVDPSKSQPTYYTIFIFQKNQNIYNFCPSNSIQYIRYVNTLFT